MDFLKSITDNKLVSNVKSVQQMMKTVANLTALISDNKVSNSVKEMLKGLRDVISEKPNITAVNHYINHFLLKLEPENQPIVIKELLEVFHERWKNVDRKTAEVASKEFDFENKTMLLFGNDINIQSLIELLDVQQKKFNLIQVISKQDKIGKEQAKIIADKGLKIKVIDDAGIGKFLSQIDVVLFGCDLIMNDVTICNSGAHLITAAAKTYSIPVFVLGDSRKILNKKFFSQSIVESLIGKDKKPASQLWKDAPENVDVIFNHIEELPNHLITKFILEKEAYTYNELNDKIEKVLVANFF